MISISQIREPSTETSNPEPDPIPHSRNATDPRHRRGTVARLPKGARDTICLMLQDGAPYRTIIQKLGPDAEGLTKHHISEWKKGGFLDWQRENQWQAELKAQQQFALQLLLTNDETKLPQVVLQIAATQVFQALRKVVPDNFAGKFDGDASDYTRLLNSIARISRSSLVFTKYTHLCEKEKVAELKVLDPSRPPGQAQSAALMKLWSDFFLGPDYDPMAHPLHEPQPATANPASDAVGRAVPPHPCPLPQGEGESSASSGADFASGKSETSNPACP